MAALKRLETVRPNLAVRPHGDRAGGEASLQSKKFHLQVKGFGAPGCGQLVYVGGLLMPRIANMARRMAAAATAACTLAGGPPPAAAQEALNAAVIFAYHRFGENDVPSTNIRLEQFEAHIEELRTGGYTVLPLPEIVAAMEEGRALPDRTVAITIDDAYLTVYTEAWPRLRDAGFPFTVFVATNIVDAGGGGRYMNWDQIRDLEAAGATIGSHSAEHGHYPEMTDAEIANDIARSGASFERELGKRPALFAYPYGEMSLAARQAVKEAGYSAAFGQHSGVAEAGLDRLYLPRFPLNEKYGSLSRFVLDANALPLGAREIAPADPVLVVNPPLFGFTVVKGVDGLDRLNCFPSPGATVAPLERLGERRFEVRLGTQFPPGRARFNCTAPTDDGRWRWFGFQFYVPRP
jgi:peptidoglycan/xylan/chitin deacetylase (PgdA/CDA1 family)